MTELTSSSIIYIDTNVLIYYIENRSQFSIRAKSLVVRAKTLGARLVTSELSFAECIYRPSRDANKQHIALYEGAFGSGLLDLYPLTSDLVLRAAREGGGLGLKLLDAVHYMSALEAGCDVFVTADRTFQSSQYLEVVGL